MSVLSNEQEYVNQLYKERSSLAEKVIKLNEDLNEVLQRYSVRCVEYDDLMKEMNSTRVELARLRSIVEKNSATPSLGCG